MSDIELPYNMATIPLTDITGCHISTSIPVISFTSELPCVVSLYVTSDPHPLQHIPTALACSIERNVKILFMKMPHA